ncbi:MAG: hypothetical protein WCO35_02155 [Candidatus Nomurabacteria bacterium]
MYLVQKLLTIKFLKMIIYGFTIILLRHDNLLNEKLSKKEKENILDLSKQVREKYLKPEHKVELLCNVYSPLFLPIYEDIKTNCKVLLSLTQEIDPMYPKASFRYIQESILSFKRDVLIILCHEKLFKLMLHKHNHKSESYLKALIINRTEIEEIK